ncbi:MAG: sigma-70 family RNA polymerase sigma factor [Acidobacteriota bacterium]
MGTGDLTSDLDLLRAVADGDRQAFERLYHRYARRLFGYLLRWLSSPEQVEEVIDDTMFVVWQQASRFELRSRVSTWIFGIAYRQAMTALRGHREHTDLEQVAEPAGLDVDLRRRELRLSLDKALNSLSADHRTVLELTYFEEFSCREIADVVGCSVNTVKTRMFYARRHLRRILPRLGWTRP